MDINKLLEENIAKSAKLYLQRQELQATLQMIQSQIQQVEMQMMRLDGEEELLNRLKNQEKENE